MNVGPAMPLRLRKSDLREIIEQLPPIETLKEQRLEQILSFLRFCVSWAEKNQVRIAIWSGQPSYLLLEQYIGHGILNKIEVSEDGGLKILKRTEFCCAWIEGNQALSEFSSAREICLELFFDSKIRADLKITGMPAI
jgi:hypothetical protein